MKCLKCHSSAVGVINSRKLPRGSKVWRRRQCQACHLIFTTKESVDIEKLLRIQSSVRQKQTNFYARGHLLQALYKAFEHSNEAETPLVLLETIEEKLLEIASQYNFVLTRAKLHEIVTETLKRYDKLAALTYSARFTKAI